MNLTHSFSLLTGVVCVVRSLIGEDYEYLSTTVAGENYAQRLTGMLANVIVKLGDTEVAKMSEQERKFIVSQLLPNDQRLILAQTRQFSFGFEDYFSVNIPYEKADGSNGEIAKRVKLEAGMFPTRPTTLQCKNYEEVQKVLELTLPVSKVKVKVPLLDAKTIAETDKSLLSSPTLITALKIRKITYFKPLESNGGTWVIFDVAKAPVKDLTFIQNKLKEAEGGIDTEIRIDHPEAEQMPEHKKKIIVDLLMCPDFFYPTEV